MGKNITFASVFEEGRVRSHKQVLISMTFTVSNSNFYVFKMKEKKITRNFLYVLDGSNDSNSVLLSTDEQQGLLSIDCRSC